MGLPISELIRRVGDNKVMFQNLDDAMTGAQLRKGGLTEVKFMTNAITTTEVATGECKCLGFVVWLPRAEAMRVVEEYRALAAGSGEMEAT